jgi:hypothetical protein
VVPAASAVKGPASSPLRALDCGRRLHRVPDMTAGQWCSPSMVCAVHCLGPSSVRIHLPADDRRGDGQMAGARPQEHRLLVRPARAAEGNDDP